MIQKRKRRWRNSDIFVLDFHGTVGGTFNMLKARVTSVEYNKVPEKAYVFTFAELGVLRISAHIRAIAALIKGRLGRGRLVCLSHTFSLMFALGLRVVRGPDWEGGDQDGGEGFVGTVVGLEGDGRRVTVQWDMGQRNIYRCGQGNKFDLRLLDSGPSGESSLISAE